MPRGFGRTSDDDGASVDVDIIEYEVVGRGFRRLLATVMPFCLEAYLLL